MRKIFLYISLLLLSTGCINKSVDSNKRVLAKVHDKYLYLTDIKDIIPENIAKRDSIAFVRSYVKDWVKTNVIIFQAEQNLPENELDFTKQLEKYRNSLIIYSYETKLIDQTLDTVVTDEEITDYYNTHMSDFQLKENIIRVAYVIIERDSANEAFYKQAFNLPDSSLFDTLYNFATDNSLLVETDTNNWISFIDIQKIIPIETYNKELFLKQNSYININDEYRSYFLKIYDFKIKDDLSPLEFKRNDIYNIIISKRKIVLAKEIRNSIYNRALKNKEFEIY